MTFLAPWVWVGLALLAAPVIIHLLGRAPTTRRAFPSLRFVQASRLRPVRMATLHDRPLLLLRLLILAAAVAALTRPVRPNTPDVVAGRTLSRAVILDTSYSVMHTPGAPVEVARQEATALLPEATQTRIFETTSPRAAIPAATAWLLAQTGPLELVVRSDFQIGSLDSLTVAAVPADIGLRLVSASRGPGAVQRVVAQAAVQRIVRTTAAGYEVLLDSAPATGVPQLYGGGTRAAGLSQAVRSAVSQVPLALPQSAALAVEVYAAGAPRPALDAPTSVEVADYLVRWIRDPLLEEAARLLPPLDSLIPGLPVLHADAFGRPLIQGGLRAGRDTATVALVLAAPLDHPGTAAVAAAARLALSEAPPPAELLSETLSTATLASWERPPGPRSGPPATHTAADAPSLAPWLWGAVLLLLGAEAVLRQRIARARALAEGPAHG